MPMLFVTCDLHLWPIDPEINGMGYRNPSWNMSVSNFCDPWCIGLWDIVRVNRQTDRQTNASENPTLRGCCLGVDNVWYRIHHRNPMCADCTMVSTIGATIFSFLFLLGYACYLLCILLDSGDRRLTHVSPLHRYQLHDAWGTLHKIYLLGSIYPRPQGNLCQYSAFVVIYIWGQGT